MFVSVLTTMSEPAYDGNPGLLSGMTCLLHLADQHAAEVWGFHTNHQSIQGELSGSRVRPCW